MKKIIIILAAFLQSNLLFAQKTIDDPNVEVRTISGSFNSIKVSDAIDLYISQGSEEAVAISASKEKFKEYIKTEVKNNTLSIFYNEGPGVHVNIGNKALKVYVSFKTLEKLHAAGASVVHVSGVIDVPSLLIDLSGASDMKAQVKSNSLSVNLSGASDLKLSGAVTNLNVDASGASELKAFDLTSDVCSIKASGASGIDVTVNKELSAHATGASDINYKGSAIIKEMNSSGSGSINKKG